jgi:hypothetical protein
METVKSLWGTKFVFFTRNQYEEMTCRVVHGEQLIRSFNVLTGVRQGCLLSPFLFLLVIDWLIKHPLKGRET